MWKEGIEMPTPVMAVEEILDILLGVLDKKTAEEFAEELLAYHRPVCYHIEE